MKGFGVNIRQVYENYMAVSKAWGVLFVVVLVMRTLLVKGGIEASSSFETTMFRGMIRGMLRSMFQKVARTNSLPVTYVGAPKTHLKEGLGFMMCF